MSALLLIGWVVAQPAQSGQRLVTDPTEVRGATRGAAAVSFDPAAPADVGGFELQARGRFLEDVGEQDSWALSTVVPLGGLTLFGGYEWVELGGPRLDRLSAGLATFVTPRLALGLAYRGLTRGAREDSAWDLGALFAPLSIVSLAFGVEGLGDPELTPAAAWRVGAAVRPLFGTRLLTLGAETRVIDDGERPDFIETRLRAESEPLEGVRVTVGWLPAREELWIGAGVALWGNELSAATASDGGEPDTVMALTLRGVTTPSAAPSPERTVELVLHGQVSGDDAVGDRRKVLSEATLALDGVAGDPTVSALHLVVGDLDVSLADIEELRAGIARVRAAGKEVTANLVDGGEKAYMVAAAASKIRLDPSVSLDLDGFAVTLLHYASTLEKVGVRFDAVGIGKYKTGPEPLTRSTASPEEREVVAEVLAGAMGLLERSLAEDRRLPPSAVREVIGRSVWTPSEALRRGLVDELSQPTDAAALPSLSAGYAAVRPPRPSRELWGPAPVVKIVPIVGAIGGGGIITGEPDVDAGAVVAELQEARTDPDVIGVVLRIDSPGGEVYASEVIWRAARVLASEKPVVASFGGIAASGGYYVATAANAILASPTTITGSIGIFMVKPDLSGLIDKLDVGAEILEEGEHADWSSLTRGLTDEERGRIREHLEVNYEVFVKRVAHGRRLTPERVRELATGRIYTGAQALELGLVDAHGGLAEAVREVVTRAGLDPEAEVAIDIPRRPSPIVALARIFSRAETPALDELVRAALSRARRLDGRALALMPYSLEVVGE